MQKKALLVLEDGTVYEGNSFGSENTVYGEVVFDTAMAGYQEMLTDPSFSGQIVVPTYPLIGNYGINNVHYESQKIQVRGFVVREYCPLPSHWQSTGSIHEYLHNNNIPGISGIDTRALTRHIRSSGTMMGILTSEMAEPEAHTRLQNFQRYGSTDFVKEVSTDKTFVWNQSAGTDNTGYRITIVDMGLKYNIARLLCQLNCQVTIVPVFMSAADILSLNPDGILLSPGPGDPALLEYAITLVKQLINKKPVMGICLGHQLIALALGAKTYKLKFGHRGGNHPVRDLTSGRIYITTQNHGYAVDADTINNGLEVSHLNSNDNTVEGLRHRDRPILSIQYHSEGAPGPMDNIYLFQNFLDMIAGGSN
jgi:carbamoyl-phosphate synthase small subunit